MKIGRNDSCPCGSGIEHEKCCLNKLEYDFIIGKNIFEKQIKPLYNHFETEIDRFLEFEILLPFQIALEDENLLSFEKEECILHYLYKLKKKIDIIEEYNNLPLEKHYTSVVVSISYNSNIFKENEDAEYIDNKFFDYALGELNKQIMAYTIHTKDDRCFHLTKEMLFPIIIMNSVNLEKKISEKRIFFLHYDVPFKKENINKEELLECLNLYNVYNENLNPFIHSESFVLKARRNFREGFYDEAVINIQTNIEILIRMVYKEVLICSGVSEQDVEKQLEEENFITIVKKRMSKYLGGTWDISLKETPINNWYKNTYILRNKVVHGGYYPTFEETNLALCAAMEFRKFIFKRLRVNKNKYSKLNTYFR